MTSNGRIAALILGCLLLVFGIWLIWADNAGWGVALFGLAVLAGTLFDRRYGARSGRRMDSAPVWEQTGEREVDSQTGEVIAVWYDPATGARRYEPIGKSPS